MDIRHAEPSDAQTLVTIINAAFRVEKFFIEGDRIDIDQVRAFLGKGEFLMAEDAGCVYIGPCKAYLRHPPLEAAEPS